MKFPFFTRKTVLTTLKAAVFLVVAGLTVLALAAAILSHQGRRDWARVKADLTARGERLSLVELRPPPLPEAQNVFGDTVWYELTDLVDRDREEDGVRVTVRETRLPAGQRQIDELDRPLTPTERAVLRARFPEFPVPENATLGALVRSAGAEPPTLRSAEFVWAVTALVGPMLDRLEALAQRPGAALVTPLPEPEVALDIGGHILKASRLFAARSRAEIALGESGRALRDISVQLRLADALSKEPLLVNYLYQIVVLELALEGISDGLKAGVWKDTELAALERELARQNVPAALAMALRGERGFGNHYAESLMNPASEDSKGRATALQQAYATVLGRLSLQIFLPAETARRNMLLQNGIDALEAAPRQGLNSTTYAQGNRAMESIRNEPLSWLRFPVLLFSMPNMEKLFGKAAEIQDRITLLRVACAVQRYARTHGTWPGTLDDLVPAELATIPRGLTDRQPVHYRTQGEGFALWVGGWQGTNQGNEPAWSWSLPDGR
jgi:hypothetical protein